MQELYLGDDLTPVVLWIPPGVAHDCRVIGGIPAHFFYVSSCIYDPEEEGRIPYNDPQISYD